MSFGFATESAYNQWKATDNTGYITSRTRLVVLKYRKTGEIVSFLMTIVDDKEYLETKHYEMWDNTYLTKDKDFNGLVLFHSTEGAFVNGWHFDYGKPTVVIKQVTNTTQNYEAAYIMRNFEYEYVKGPDNMLDMTLPINSMNSMDGYLHTHPQGGLSIFSTADIKAIYDGWVR